MEFAVQFYLFCSGKHEARSSDNIVCGRLERSLRKWQRHGIARFLCHADCHYQIASLHTCLSVCTQCQDSARSPDAALERVVACLEPNNWQGGGSVLFYFLDNLFSGGKALVLRILQIICPTPSNTGSRSPNFMHCKAVIIFLTQLLNKAYGNIFPRKWYFIK